jgi:DNA polymerase III epsilon subunit-like protein
MKYVSIDIETTGLKPGFHQMIEFGAVMEDTENPLPICQLPKFRALIKHNEYTISPFCIGLHKDLLDELTFKQRKNPLAWYTKLEDETHLCMQGALTNLFSHWLRENGIDTAVTKVVVAGKNFQGFDLKFIEPVFMSKIQFHRRVLDPTVLFTLPTDKEPPNLGKCAERAGLEFTGDGYHTAVSDAIMVIELLRAGWKRIDA